MVDKRITLALLLLLICALRAGAETQPPVESQADVFVSGRDGYAAYRIPAIVCAPDGALLAFAEARKYSLSDPGGKGNDIDLVMKRSADGGRTWSAMTVIEDPGEMWSAANPAAVVDRQTGSVWLHYVRCRPGAGSTKARPGTDDVRNLVRHSEDNGKSWSEPEDITRVARDLKDPDWRSSYVGPGGVIQDRQGRLVAPVWKVDNPWAVFAIYSEDHGKTWRRGGEVPGCGGDENQLTELADGALLMDIRQKKEPHRWLAESRDGGKTWGAPRPGVTVTPCCCSLLRWTQKNEGGKLGPLLWSGPLGPGRNKLGLRVSKDEGKTFGEGRLISGEPAAYSALVVLKDQSVGVLWERGNYKTLTFTLLDKKWLETGE